MTVPKDYAEKLRYDRGDRFMSHSAVQSGPPVSPGATVTAPQQTNATATRNLFVLWAPDQDMHQEISELVDKWLTMLAQLPFFYLRSDAIQEHRQWVISHALEQPDLDSAEAFVNQVMWSLRFGEPLLPVPGPTPPDYVEPLDEVDLAELATWLDGQLKTLDQRGVVIGTQDKAAMLKKAAGEGNVAYAKLLLDTWLLAEQERQQGELWDLVAHWVGELATVGLNVSKAAQVAIMRRALSAPDLGVSHTFLMSLFQRMYDKASRPRLGWLAAEHELALRSGILALRRYSSGADEELAWEDMRQQMMEGILRQRYRAHGATGEETIPYDELMDIKAQREWLGDLLAGYQAEVDDFFAQVEELAAYKDIIGDRAKDLQQRMVKKLHGLWEWLESGKTSTDVKELGTRIAQFARVEATLKDGYTCLSWVKGESDMLELGRSCDQLKAAFEAAFKDLTDQQALGCKNLIAEAVSMLGKKVGLEVSLKDVRDLIDRLNSNYLALVTPSVPIEVTAIPPGSVDPRSLDSLTALKTWVGDTSSLNHTLTNISQAINDLPGRGRWTHSGYLRDGKTEVYHCSAGKAGVSSCTLFFIELPTGVLRIVAIGEHLDSTSYRIGWSNPDYTSAKSVQAKNWPNKK
jgi:hypothetical protein